MTTEPIRIEGELLRAPDIKVVVELVERAGPARWWVTAAGPTVLSTGDRLRFGDQSNAVCLIGTLNAVVLDNGPNTLCLEFEFYGSVLDETIAAVAQT